MRKEQDVSPSSASIDTPNPPTEHAHWQVARLIVAMLVCALIVGAAIAYDKFG
ncbi:hypothetical protein [Vitiosangium sp. GDMCC 1.1324]|uniref:hypothetical protein n=1 Tax=Vitiosangium sp. (strain GDMCC 1.1324) TaxID=2138576 RepID=UPI00130E6D7B|nr:hypothetical protein [Vitiosangium sp. GDMCC 1.1324]